MNDTAISNSTPYQYFILLKRQLYDLTLFTTEKTVRGLQLYGREQIFWRKTHPLFVTPNYPVFVCVDIL